MTYLSCTAQPPAAGWLFPGNDPYDFDPETIARELAEIEAQPGTEEFDDALWSYEVMSEVELIARYRDAAAYY